VTAWSKIDYVLTVAKRMTTLKELFENALEDARQADEGMNN
jgi:hypothetical protein